MESAKFDEFDPAIIPLLVPLHPRDFVRYSHFAWEDWPIHPVPEDERHVLRHLHCRSKQLQAQLDNEEGENRKKLVAEYNQVFRLLCTLDEEWKTVDKHFDVFVTSLSYLEEEGQLRSVPYDEYENLMLSDIVPRAKSYVDALLGVLFRRTEACWGVLKGRREVLMTEYDFQELIAERDHLMAAHSPTETTPVKNHLLRRAVARFNKKIEYFVQRENIINGNCCGPRM